MTNFPYNYTVPGANNDPSVDQPDMLKNFQSIGGQSLTSSGIIGVDHVGFNAANGGTHLQVTYSSNNIPGAQTNPASTAYTNTGTATLVSENLFKNANGIFSLSAIKAFCCFNTSSTGATVPAINRLNTNSLIGRFSSGGTTSYTINLTTSAMISTTGCVFVSFSDYRAISTDQYNYTISPNTIIVNVKTIISETSPYRISVAVLQF